MVLVDTDVLIWYMRGNPKAKKAIDELGQFSISAINYMELVQGLRNSEELRVLHDFIKKRRISLIHTNEEISRRAVLLMEQFSLSNGLRMADALVAATAVSEGLILFTANIRHYSFLNIEMKRFRP